MPAQPPIDFAWVHKFIACSLCSIIYQKCFSLYIFKHVGFYQLWYMLSKTLAEEAAWKFAKENGIDMVTINPGWVIGPLLQPTLNLSVEEVLKLLKGTLLQLMRISFLCLSFYSSSNTCFTSILSQLYPTALQMTQKFKSKLINKPSQDFHSST